MYISLSGTHYDCTNQNSANMRGVPRSSTKNFPLPWTILTYVLAWWSCSFVLTNWKDCLKLFIVNMWSFSFVVQSSSLLFVWLRGRATGSPPCRIISVFSHQVSSKVREQIFLRSANIFVTKAHYDRQMNTSLCRFSSTYWRDGRSQLGNTKLHCSGETLRFCRIPITTEDSNESLRLSGVITMCWQLNSNFVHWRKHRKTMKRRQLPKVVKKCQRATFNDSHWLVAWRTRQTTRAVGIVYQTCGNNSRTTNKFAIFLCYLVVKHQSTCILSIHICVHLICKWFKCIWL